MFKLLKCSAFLLVVLWNGTVSADIDVRVGGAGCTFSTIQAAIDAALPVNGITNILIARNQTYTAQAININGKNVRLIGGYANCTQTVRDTTRTTISGVGGSARSVINVLGSTSAVAFINLNIEGGDESEVVNQFDSDIFGGAVDITGGPHDLVFFEDTRIEGNEAGKGGAISIRGNGNDASDNFLQLSYNTQIFANRARSEGGGVYCKDATVHLKGNRSAIRQNLAGYDNFSGSGGGMFVDDCQVRIAGADSFEYGPVIASNVATDNGGGIYAYGSRTDIDIYNADPNSPTRIKDNVAGRFGGGLNIEQGARVEAWDVVIESNLAKQGGGAVALYDDGQSNDSSFALIKNTASNVGIAPQGNPANNDFAFMCTNPRDCGLIRNNIARSDAGVRQHGSAIRFSSDVVDGASAYLRGARVVGNVGATTVKIFGEERGALLEASGTIFDGNDNSGLLIDAEGGNRQFIIIRASTFANNINQASFLIRPDFGCIGTDALGSDFFLFESNIVDQPGKEIVDIVPEAGCLRHVLVRTAITNVAATDAGTIKIADPMFVDAPAGDFRLKADSPALDVLAAPVTLPNWVTRGGASRVIDLPFVANELGPMDLGAFEMAVADFPAANLRVSFLAQPTRLFPGDNAYYQFQVVNEGPSISSLTDITATMSDNLTSCRWSCAASNAGGICPAASGTGNINGTGVLPAGQLLLFDLAGC